MPLHDLPEAANAAIRVAVHDRRSEAVVTLHPAELGAVRIHLSYESGSVTATIVADHADAAQALAQAAPELRRALEAAGLPVHDLDVGHRGDAQREASQREAGHSAGDAQPERRSHDRAPERQQHAAGSPLDSLPETPRDGVDILA